MKFLKNFIVGTAAVCGGALFFWIVGSQMMHLFGWEIPKVPGHSYGFGDYCIQGLLGIVSVACTIGLVMMFTNVGERITGDYVPDPDDELL